MGGFFEPVPIPLSPRGPGPARRVAWVDIDRGAQVNKLVAQRHKLILSVLAHRTLFTWIPWSTSTPQKHSFLWGPRAPG